MTFISLISAWKTLATARHPGLSVDDYIDQTFVAPGATHADLPGLSVAVRPVRSRLWTVEVGVAVIGRAVPDGPAPPPGGVPDYAGQGRRHGAASGRQLDAFGTTDT
jgi:hypothetical protein